MQTGGDSVEETTKVHRDDRVGGENSGFPSGFRLGPDDVARAAVLLAITKDAETESACKRHIEEQGWRVVATEVGGLLSDLPQKIVFRKNSADHIELLALRADGRRRRGALGRAAGA